MRSLSKSGLLAAVALVSVCKIVPTHPQTAPNQAMIAASQEPYAFTAMPLPDLHVSVGEIIRAGPQVPKQAEKWQIDGMIAALQDPYPAVRMDALRELTSNTNLLWKGIPESLVTPFLLNNSPLAKSLAILALGEMQAKDQETALVTILKEEQGDIEARSEAASALALMKARDQEAALVTILKDKREYKDVRSTAISALGNMQARDQEAPLVTLLNDKKEDPFLRSDAASALGDIQAKDQETLLVTLLKDKHEHPNIRIAAALALGDIQARDQETLLVTLFKDWDEDEDLRSAAAFALGIMQATDREAELVALLKDRNDSSHPRSAAASALNAMQVKNHKAVLVTLLNNKGEDEDVRSVAASALGAMEAKDQEAVLATLLKDQSENLRVRRATALALGDMQATDQEAALVPLLKDTIVRSSVASALGAMQARDQKSALITLLNVTDNDVNGQAIAALIRLAPFETVMLPQLADPYYYNHERQAEIRFLCHYLLGGAPASELVLKRVMFEAGEGKPQPVPIASVDEARKTLQAFHEVLPAHPEHTDSAPYFEQQVLQIAHEWKNSWTSADHNLLESLSRQMSTDNAAALRGLIEVPLWQTILQKFWKIIAIQIILWIALLYFYPTSTQVQAFFFWNRLARKFFGLGYVDFCLTWIPFLRNRLLAPFRDELIADAQLSDENLNDYFEDIQVRHGENCYPIAEAIPEVLGQIVLEGESGLGKSIFLRRLVNKSVRATSYFPADNCDRGVFESIQSKLKGKAGDENFLRSIIWSGGLSIVIDGLNEVTVETREKIRRFVDDFPKANVLLATQPLLWKRPPKAKVYRLLPLTDDRIQDFLESRYPTFTPPVALTENDYKNRCREYLQNVLGDTQSEEDRSAARLVLSNPMDLTTAAQILVSGETPTLKNLQKQQFDAVDHDFRDTHPGQQFPLRQFSESVYQRLLLDEITLDSSQFFEPIQALLAHKMALTQNEVDADGKPIREWVFRHDKIRDFFLVQAFEFQQDERILKHMDDPRFRGVYLMLASQLPLGQANELRDALVDRAAETKDHHLSDAVVEVLKSRRTATATSGRPSA
jgi:HEAT repeat protein